MTREELIKELQACVSRGIYSGGGYRYVEVDPEDALAAAKMLEAQAPTNDEREALGYLIRDIYRKEGFYAPDQVVADAILASGFRRPAQTEPTEKQVHSAAVAIDPAAWEPGIFYWEASGARDNSLELARAALIAAFAAGQEEQS